MTALSPIVCAALVAMNVLTFSLYGADKFKARRGAWRIRESTLLGTAACFGALGALVGMYAFRHKTKHRAFTLGVPAMLLVQLAVLAALLVRG